LLGSEGHGHKSRGEEEDSLDELHCCGVVVVVWYGMCVVFGVDIDVDCLLIRGLEKSEWGW
jgi:hypothetical protein